MAKASKYFEFKQCVSIVKATGQQAKNLKELRKLIASVGDESILHHTHQYFIKGHMLDYTNDFSQWAGEYLEERALAERLTSIDPYTLKSITAVRKELIREIDAFLDAFPEPRDVTSGNEFYFNETINLVFPVGVKTKNLAEFLVALEHVDSGSIYYHFYDSRIRLGEGAVDDFSRWIEHTLGRKNLADSIRAIDPFMHSIESIRSHIKNVVEEYVRADMEGVAT
ncbi:MAG: hypothetical protein JSW20_01110 [Nitrospiraceae bacterium]|nr:MAG: hypothetical protein JSW20_01110 [Nitrospiraceae bacterium]